MWCTRRSPAVCRALARDGWSGAATYRTNAAAATELGAELEKVGCRFRALQVDLRDQEQVAVAVREVGDGLSAVVYAAGPHITMDYVAHLAPDRFRDQLVDDAVACPPDRR